MFRSGQNYKIYINDSVLHLSGNGMQRERTPGSLVVVYRGHRKSLFNYIDLLEKSPVSKEVTIVTDDLKKLFKDFKSLYKTVKAAGGVVRNGEDVLFIYRRGSWDLPKGKLDKGETYKQAAVREVLEETGLSEVRLGGKLCTTYHTYKLEGRRILKKTAWYIMETEERTLSVQHEEDIEKGEWMPVMDIKKRKLKTYRSITGILDQYLWYLQQ
jgi:8-oxo-dGTP pyrophosphatase MutT (NUDIX family)